MSKKTGTLNKTNRHEFLNKYEKRDLRQRETYIESIANKHPDFRCECGSRELVDLRPGFGECGKCKLPYILEDDGLNNISKRWAQSH